MVEVKVSDLLGISLVMGIMVATMGSFVAFFSTGMEGDPLEALRIGGYVGAAACGITLLYGGWRLFEIKSGRGNKREPEEWQFLVTIKKYKIKNRFLMR